MSHRAAHRAATRRPNRRLTAGVLTLTTAATMVGLSLSAAQASSVTSAVFTGTGTVSVDNTVYAKQGSVLTLSVTTSSDTKCVDVTGAATLPRQTSSTAKSTWTFTTTAPAGDGVQAFTVAASPNFNANGCSGQTNSTQASYTVDNTGPAVTSALTPAPNAAGWNKANVTVSWSATDAGSGVAGAQPFKTETVSGNGRTDLTVAAQSDRLGNTGADGAVTVRVDKSAPTITATQTKNPDGTTTVTFTCDDSNSGGGESSGIATCVADGSTTNSKTVQPGVTVTGTATDKAGNTATSSATSPAGDTTAPLLSGAPSTQPASSGWYKGDVTVRWTASDPESGIPTAPADTTITGEGPSLTSTQTVKNGAGLSTTATSSPAVKIDRTAPTTGISGTSNSWVNGDVTVSLSATDNMSQVASTSYTVDGGTARTGTTFTLSTEGDHTLTFFSTDNAGNAEARQTAHVRIDKTAPSISHDFTPLAYTDGAWTNKDVTVTFTCADQGGSGLAGCTAPVTRSTEGVSTVTGTASDGASNTASDTASVRIDKTAPTVTATATGVRNAAGWYKDDVTVSYTASDTGGSGISGAPAARVLGQGAGQSASATVADAAGNSASAGVTGIDVDKTDPVLTGTFPTGWHTDDVTVHWTCTDALSGVAVPPVDDVVTGEGGNLSSAASCTDEAGNTATKTVAGIKIDRTAPTTTADVPERPASGWYGDDVQVTLDGSDNLSDVAATVYTLDGGAEQAYSGPFWLGEGKHTVTFRSKDGAGNVETSGTPLTVDVDKTAPATTVTNPISPAGGWFTISGVPFAFDARDTGSGIRATYYTIDGGDAQTYGEPFTDTLSDGQHEVSYWSVDLAGNAEGTRRFKVLVDVVPPTVTATRTPVANSSGWNNTDVTVHFDAKDTDPGSGVAAGSVTPDTVVSSDTSTTGVVVDGSAMDAAGNTGTRSVTVKLDKTKPSVTGSVVNGTLGKNGWYRSPVTVHFACSDALSGMASCQDDMTLSNDGAAQSAGGSGTDLADNVGTATVGGINIDSVNPTITNVPLAATGVYTLGAVPAATCTATDSLSGLDTCTVAVTGGNASGVGTFAWTATATDNAGNTSRTTGTYKVIYRFDGFLQPINDTAHQIGASTSIFKAGTTVPAKFQLKRADGTVVQAATAPVWLVPLKGSATTAPVDETLTTAPADSGSAYKYDATGTQYSYNWKTGAGGNYWRIGVTLDDGQTYYVTIALR